MSPRGGREAYRDELELALRDPQGLKRWVPVGGRITGQEVPDIDIECTVLRWAEVDFPPTSPTRARWWCRMGTGLSIPCTDDLFGRA